MSGVDPLPDRLDTSGPPHTHNCPNGSANGATQAPVSARLELGSALRRALVHDELMAHYQPIVAFGSGGPTHFEALIRWNRPGVRLVQPSEFIGIAEDIGLINPIGTWVVRRAVRDCVRWQEHSPGVGVSVNVSVRQFDHDAIVCVVSEVLRESGLAAELLTLEITESALLDNVEQTRAALDELHAMGVRISLDDYGSGYSSLTYLHRLPFAELKIDGSFVATLDEPCADTTLPSRLPRTMVQLGRALGLRVVAKGIDSEAKLWAVRELGCHYGQGFLFGRPAPYAQLVHH